MTLRKAVLGENKQESALINKQESLRRDGVFSNRDKNVNNFGISLYFWYTHPSLILFYKRPLKRGMKAKLKIFSTKKRGEDFFRLKNWTS